MLRASDRVNQACSVARRARVQDRDVQLWNEGGQLISSGRMRAALDVGAVERLEESSMQRRVGHNDAKYECGFVALV